MVKHTQIIHRQQLANYLSVFDHAVGLGLKWLNSIKHFQNLQRIIICTLSRREIFQLFKVQAKQRIPLKNFSTTAKWHYSSLKTNEL